MDVGVNLGQTLIKLRAIDASRRYIGFEPNPSCAHYAQELIRVNRYANCTIVPAGLFLTSGVLTLHRFGQSVADASASLLREYRPAANVIATQLVPVFTYSDVAHVIGDERVAAIKVDVEGAELEVLSALKPRLDRDRPRVIVEILPAYKAANEDRNRRQQAIASLCKEIGFSIFQIIKDPDGGYLGLRAIPAFEIHSDLEQCDYVLVPTERPIDGLSTIDSPG